MTNKFRKVRFLFCQLSRFSKEGLLTKKKIMKFLPTYRNALTQFLPIKLDKHSIQITFLMIDDRTTKRKPIIPKDEKWSKSKGVTIFDR